MKLIIASTYTLTGISSKTSQPYQMHRAGVLTPHQNVESEKFQNRGFGFSLIDLAISNDFFTTLSNHFVSTSKGGPIQVDVDTALDRDGKNIIISFSKLS